MPKKTRKEKRQSDIRRTTSPQSPQYTFSSTSSTRGNLPTLEDSSELHAIGADLTKTTILAVLAIALEVTLYVKPWVR